MIRPRVALISLLTLALATLSFANESAEVRARQQAAHRERGAQKNERDRAQREAAAQFRSFVQGLGDEGREKSLEIDAELAQTTAESEAKGEAKLAEAKAEYEKELIKIISTPGNRMDEATIRDMRTKAKAFSEKQFDLRKKAAVEIHAQRMVAARKKDAQLAERDRNVLAKAKELGLDRAPQPIIASGSGGSLTPQEERWNQGEKRDVEQIRKTNDRLLRDYRIAGDLRKLEIRGTDEDFELLWKEKKENNDLQSEELFYSMLMTQAHGKEINLQELMGKASELSKQRKLIQINFAKLRKQSRARRAEEKRKLKAD